MKDYYSTLPKYNGNSTPINMNKYLAQTGSSKSTPETIVSEYYLPGSPGGFQTITKSAGMQNLQDCINACDNDIKCLIYAYDKSNGTCYYKNRFDFSDLNGKNQSDMFLSGPSQKLIDQNKNKNVMVWKGIGISNDKNGNWSHQFKTPTVDMCRNVAKFAPNVDAFEWNSRTKDCKLRSGSADILTANPELTSGGVYITTDPNLMHWLSTKLPTLENEFQNWLQNKFPGEKTTFDNWLKNNYPNDLALFKAWQSKFQGNLQDWKGDITNIKGKIPEWKNEYEQYIDFMSNKYPMYKAAYDHLKTYINKIPADKRTNLEDFIVWMMSKYPNVVDRIFQDADTLYEKLKEWISIVLQKLQSLRNGTEPISPLSPVSPVIPVSPLGPPLSSSSSSGSSSSGSGSSGSSSPFYSNVSMNSTDLDDSDMSEKKSPFYYSYLGGYGGYPMYSSYTYPMYTAYGGYPYFY